MDGVLKAGQSLAIQNIFVVIKLFFYIKSVSKLELVYYELRHVDQSYWITDFFLMLKKNFDGFIHSILTNQTKPRI